MKISFVWDWENPWLQMLTWKDGLARVIQLLSEEFDVRVYSIGEGVFKHDYFPIYLQPTPKKLADSILEWKPDKILVWGDFTRPTIPFLGESGIPMAICMAGGTYRNYAHLFQLVFVESQSYYDDLKREGFNVRLAFGTNTKLYRPIKQTKIWDAIFPATFATWKRHKLFADALGEKGMTCGWMYKVREADCWKGCQEKGVTVLPHVSANVLAYLYNASRTCVVTSNDSGGSQRTVLEAMSCGISPVVMSDSDKTSEYVLKSGFGKVVSPNVEDIRSAIDDLKKNPQDPQVGINYIKLNYSEYIYFKQLKEGLLTL